MDIIKYILYQCTDQLTRKTFFRYPLEQETCKTCQTVLQYTYKAIFEVMDIDDNRLPLLVYGSDAVNFRFFSLSLLS